MGMNETKRGPVVLSIAIDPESGTYTVANSVFAPSTADRDLALLASALAEVQVNVSNWRVEVARKEAKGEDPAKD